jgi:hypothetical protein
MAQQTFLDELSHRHDRFRFNARAPVEEEREQCSFGKQYEAYVNEVCQTVQKNPSHITVNEGYLEIFLKWMEWRTAVPKSHRNHIGERGHRCIFHALESGYALLRRLELSLPTPKLYLPPAVLPPEPPKIPPPPLFPDVFINEPQ